MLETRFEDDMAEISGGGYLLLCAGRQRLFMEDSIGGPVPLAAVRSFIAADGAIVVAAATGDLRCPFEGASAADLGDVASRLNDCLASWR